MERVLITAALPYINGVPHLGHIAGSHLPADIFARYCRLCNKKTLFVGGTDEHGTPIEITARNANIELERFKKVMREVHRKIYEWFEISYDIFGNTSSKVHAEFVQEFFLKLKEKGYIKEGTMSVFYCENCRLFLPGRYVEGTCHYCGYEHANADQCENCGKAMTTDTLLNPKCKICGSKPTIKETKHLFFELSKVEEELKQYLESKKEVFRKHVVNYALSWVEEGLRDRCITRDIKNGIAVPGYEGKVFYVWFDALQGYISFVREYKGKKAEEIFWVKNKNIYHFLGKDNIPFHAVFWPAMLIVHGKYSLPYNVVGLNYLLFKEEKFSKSRGIGIFCDRIMEANIDVESLRFYLASVLPETSDTSFSWEEFAEQVNTNLIGNIANFAFRTLKLAAKHKKINKSIDEKLAEEADSIVEEYKALMDKVELRLALSKVIELAILGNKYLSEKEPWKLSAGDAEKVLYNALEVLRILAILIAPYTPRFASEIAKHLTSKLVMEDVKFGKKEAYEKIEAPAKPFFKKISEKDIVKWQEVLSKTKKIEHYFK